MARRRGGDYRTRVVILARALATADTTGEEVESWPDPDPGTGEAWAKIDATAGAETTDQPRYAYRTLTLRFREVVTLAAIDKVRFKDTGDEYTVTGVWTERRAEGNGSQTVCTLSG